MPSGSTSTQDRVASGQPRAAGRSSSPTLPAPERRSAVGGPVFWLPDQPILRAFPVPGRRLPLCLPHARRMARWQAREVARRLRTSGTMRRSSPVTATGSRRIHTGFPQDEDAPHPRPTPLPRATCTRERGHPPPSMVDVGLAQRKRRRNAPGLRTTAAPSARSLRCENREVATAAPATSRLDLGPSAHPHLVGGIETGSCDRWLIFALLSPTLWISHHQA